MQRPFFLYMYTPAHLLPRLRARLPLRYFRVRFILYALPFRFIFAD